MPEWPFANPRNTAAIATRQVVEQGAPILLVTHDADNGAWQALCCTTTDTGDARVVGLGRLYDRDTSISVLADLPLGWRAWRASPAEPWRRAALTREEQGDAG